MHTHIRHQFKGCINHCSSWQWSLCHIGTHFKKGLIHIHWNFFNILRESSPQVDMFSDLIKHLLILAPSNKMFVAYKKKCIFESRMGIYMKINQRVMKWWNFENRNRKIGRFGGFGFLCCCFIGERGRRLEGGVCVFSTMLR